MSQESNNQPQKDGGQRRQGGQNRNRNRNRNSNRNRQGNQNSKGDGQQKRQGQGQGNKGRQGGNRPQGKKKPNNNQQGRQSGGGQRRRQQPKPVPLTFWEKILKFFGLYKAPTRPPRRQSSAPQNTATKPPKSNTRDARKQGKPNKQGPKKPSQPKAIPAKKFDGEFPVETQRLYVGNLSYDVNEHDLEDLFKGVGNVRKVEIVYNRHTHRSKGYAFIQMFSVEEAKRAVEVLHDQPFMGRVLVVNGASSKPKDKPNKPEGSQEKAPKTSEQE